MNGLIHILCFLLLSEIILGQDSAIFKNELEIKMNFEQASNHLSNEFVGAIYRGDYLDDDLKYRTYNRIQNNNRWGVDANAGMRYIFKPDSLFKKENKDKFLIEYNQIAHAHANYSKDAFAFLFFGNDIFGKQNFNFNGLNVQALNYSKFSLGYITQTDSVKASYEIKFSYLAGHHYFNLFAPKAYINNNDYPFSQAYDLNYEATFTNSQKFISGSGMSLDFVISNNINFFGKDLNLKVSVMDLGFINFKNNAQSLSVDTNFVWEGLPGDSLINLIQSQDISFVDSVKKSFWPLTNTGFNARIPTTLNTIINIPLNKGSFSFVLQYKITAAYKPLLVFCYSIPLNNFLNIESGLRIGGYNRASAVLNITTSINNKISFKLGTQQMIGLVLPKRTSGLSVFSTLTYSF